MDDRRESGFSLFGKFFLATFIVLPSSSIWNGFVLSKMWSWFVAPLGAPTIGIAQAIGLSLLASLFFYGIARKKTDTEESFGILLASGIFDSLLSGTLFLLFGWIVFQFV